MREQRKGRKIAMTKDELDGFLNEERTCRVGTITSSGAPHVTPLWYVWDGENLWLNSIVKSQRWTDVQKNPRVSIMVDAGVDYMELRGVEIAGTVAPFGEVPRAGEANDELVPVERAYALKYHGSPEMHYDGRHAWLKVTPDKISSWDFRKLASL
ncbi:MAG: pyridoxamine 5'-phosphate oxidase family protein [Acidimicrobiia bacterium]